MYVWHDKHVYTYRVCMHLGLLPSALSLTAPCEHSRWNTITQLQYSLDWQKELDECAWRRKVCLPLISRHWRMSRTESMKVLTITAIGSRDHMIHLSRPDDVGTQLSEVQFRFNSFFRPAVCMPSRHYRFLLLLFKCCGVSFILIL